MKQIYCLQLIERPGAVFKIYIFFYKGLTETRRETSLPAEETGERGRRGRSEGKEGKTNKSDCCGLTVKSIQPLNPAFYLAP